MRTALVCGAGGFIGGHLVKRLKAEGFWVCGVDLKFHEYSETESDDFIIGDLRDPYFCRSLIDRRFDEVYQLAADMGGAGFIFTDENDAKIMYNSAAINLNVLNACYKRAIRRIFYSSSACMYPAYNQEDSDSPNCEESSAYPAAPDSEYGWEKLFSERLYLAYSRCYRMDVRIARYHNIFGPEGTWIGGREKVPAALCRKVAMAPDRGTIEIWGDGRQTRSFLYIDECVEATVRLMRSDFTGPVNIGSEEMVTIDQLADLIMDIAGKRLDKYHIPGPLGVRGRNSDNRLIRAKLDWAPSQPLIAGLPPTYAWIEQQVQRKKPGGRFQHVSITRPSATQTSASSVGLVSVIIPAYNACVTVERTISSVVNQTYSNLEVLVVDDGSTDETALLVQRMADADPRIRLLQKPNGGLVSARNFGIAHASGEFIAPIDADDLWHPEKIAKQVRLMRERGDRGGLVYCWSREIDAQDRVLRDVSPCSLRGNVYAALIIRNFVSSGAPLVRKRCVEEVGGYDATLLARGADCCADLKFNLDIAERFEFDLVPEFLFLYRVQAGSMSTDIEAMLRSQNVVTEKIRARHPELPNKVFRWANGHQNREYGLAHISKGNLLRGARLLLRALREDPSATIRVGTARLFARLRRLGEFGQPLAAIPHGRPGGGILKRHFLEVDPTAFCEPPRATWTRERIAYLAELPLERFRKA